MAEGGSGNCTRNSILPEEDTGERFSGAQLSKNLVDSLNKVGLSVESVAQRRNNILRANIACNMPHHWDFNKTPLLFMSGSVAEGLVGWFDQTSDLDLQFVCRYNVKCTGQSTNPPYSFPFSNGVYELEDSVSNPLFKRLRYVFGSDCTNLIQHNNGCFYLSHAVMKSYFLTGLTDNDNAAQTMESKLNVMLTNANMPADSLSLQSFDFCGPSIATSINAPFLQFKHDVDFVYTIPCPCWPQEFNEWFMQKRIHQWPPANILKKVQRFGCRFVGKGFKGSPEYEIEWRISFSLAEKLLVEAFNDTQLKCYYLMKIMLKREIQPKFKKVLSSYHVKTAMFWVCEESYPTFFIKDSLFICFQLCLKMLISFLTDLNCPCYFKKNVNLLKQNVSQEVYANLRIYLSKNMSHHIPQNVQVYLKKYTPFYKLFSSIFDSTTLHSITKFINRHLTQYVASLSEIEHSEEIPRVCLSTSYDIIRTSIIILRLDINCVHIIFRDILPFLSCIALSELFKVNLGNKRVYQMLRKHLSFMPRELSVESSASLLKRATVYFKSGKINESMVIALNVIETLSPSNVVFVGSHYEVLVKNNLELLYKQMYFLSNKAKLSQNVIFSPFEINIVPEFISVEMNVEQFHDGKSTKGWAYVDSIIYAISLVIVCQDEVRDISTRDEYLQQLSDWNLNRKIFLCYPETANRILHYFQAKFTSG